MVFVSGVSFLFFLLTSKSGCIVMFAVKSSRLTSPLNSALSAGLITNLDDDKNRDKNDDVDVFGLIALLQICVVKPPTTSWVKPAVKAFKACIC